MKVFLLLVLVELSTGAYDTKLAPMPSLEFCEGVRKKVEIPQQSGLSYSLSCIQVRSTAETEVRK